MRRAHCLTFGLMTVALGTGLADASMAQTAQNPAPLRYLNWAGRGDPTVAPVAMAPTGQPLQGQRRPNRVIPHGGAALTPAPAADASPPAPRRTLTPANAWLRAPAPVAPAPAAPPPVAPPAPQPVAAARTTPEFLPEQGGRGQPAPADIVLATPQPAPAATAAPPPADPMAPRRDAPIFRVQQPTAAPVVADPAQNARRYSVHRQNGQEPDALSMPASATVDVVGVNLDQTIASQDLAQPAPAPNLIRDAQGRVRAQPASPEGDYQ